MSEKTTNTTDALLNDRFENGTLDRFERNRYFNGKLMTARDMWTEQQYHARRLHALARGVAGEGIVDGLDVIVSGGEEALTVRISAGLALDSLGRPVVVPQDRQVTIDDNAEVLNADRVSVFLEYDDCVRESVPISGSKAAGEEECAYNRVLEIYDVHIERADRDETYGKVVPAVDFPTREDLTSVDGRESPAPDDPGLATIAASYEKVVGDQDRTSVFLGVFVDDTDGEDSDEWSAEKSTPLARMYSNDMLYAATAHHAADFRNPHQVTLETTGEAQQEPTLSIVDDESDDPNVQFRSRDETVTVELDDGQTIDFSIANHTTDLSNPHQVTLGISDRGSDDGATFYIIDDEGQGADIELVSTDGSVDVDLEERAIDLSVDSLLKRIEELEKTVEDLESRLGDWSPRFDSGEVVVDKEADEEQDPAVVIAEFNIPIRDWTVYGDETVADQNPSYNERESVALVTFEHLLNKEWDDWDDADPANLYQGVIDRGIKFHAFPRTRLERNSQDNS